MAKKTKTMTASEQIEVMKHLSQEGVAWLAGVTARAIRDNAGGIPRNQDSSYNAQEVFEYYKGRMPAVELSDEDAERAMQAGDMLLDDVPNEAWAILQLVEDLRRKHGDAGIIAALDLIRQSFGELIRQRVARREPLPSDDHRLKLNCIVWCSCGRRRMGQQWVKAPRPSAAQLILDLCPSCHAKEKEKDTRTTRKRAEG